MIGMLATKYKHGDYFLGRMSLFGRFGTLWPSGIDPKDGCAVTLGRPGSGKSTAAAIPAVALHDGSVLVYDLKQGEITKACAAARGAGGQHGEKGRGDKVCIVDPAGETGMADEAKAHYNPLEEIAQEKNTDDALRLIFKLAEGLIKSPDGGGGQNAWVYDGAKEAAYGLIAFVVECYPPSLRNLVTVRQLLQTGDPERLKLALQAKTPGIDTAFDALLLRMTEESGGRFGHVIVGQAADMQKMDARQLGPIQKALSDATKWLDLRSFQKAVSSCDFMMRDFRRERLSVFICLPLNEVTGLAAGFARMFLTLFMQAMYRCPNPPKKPVLCLVDEFPQLGKISDFLKIGPTMRSYGVKLWIFLQDINQGRSVYGREDFSGFMGCAAFVQVMAMTHDETIDWLVRSLGERAIKERQPDGRFMSRPYPLLDREQASRYLVARDGNQIVLRFHDRPLRLKTAPYHWFLPFWMYTPNPAFPEPRLQAWARKQAMRKAEAAKSRR